MTRRTFIRSLLISMAIASTMCSQEQMRPNFSGRWRMIKEQSDFGRFGAPDIIVRVVDQHDSTMNVHTVQTKGKNTTTSDTSYFTSGDITDNSLAGRDASSKAFWDGNTLVIRTTTKDSKGDQEEIIDRWDLSADKNTLTTNSHIETESGGADLKLVCRRETLNR